MTNVLGYILWGIGLNLLFLAGLSNPFSVPLLVAAVVIGGIGARILEPKAKPLEVG